MVLEFSITNTFSISEKQTISFESALTDPETDKSHCVDCNGKKILKTACIYGANASGKTRRFSSNASPRNARTCRKLQWKIDSARCTSNTSL